jgi:hypothetical protein
MAKLIAEPRSFLYHTDLARYAPSAVDILWLGNPDTVSPEVVEGEALKSRVIGEVKGFKRHVNFSKRCTVQEPGSRSGLEDFFSYAHCP